MKAWKITKDLGNAADSPENETGTWGNLNGTCLIRGGKVKGITHAGESICPATDEQLTVKFRLKDDDGEVCYEGKMTHELADSHEILRPLDDFAEGNVGCTNMEIWSNVKNDWDLV